jgi:hypothetical protein
MFTISTCSINAGDLEEHFSGAISGTNNDSKIKLNTNRI